MTSIYSARMVYALNAKQLFLTVLDVLLQTFASYAMKDLDYQIKAAV